jgi:hypothetical protein
MTRRHQLTRFPLEGSHRSTDCEACHVPAAQGNLQYVGLSTDCVSCHQPDFAAAKNPDHVAGGLPQNCEQCHASTLWTRGFNHDATAFPLTGAHRATPCDQCHVNGQYTGTPTQCAACHQDDYDASTTPPHAQVGFGTDCASCHRTTAWDTGFDHNLTAYPLTGQHKTAPCASCHVNNVYRGRLSASTATSRIMARRIPITRRGVPHDLELHAPPTGTGDLRPRFGGSHLHRGKWNTYMIAMIRRQFTQFTCLTCHEHSRAEMDDKHRGRSGYQYASQDCLRCHPRGQED